MLYVIRRLPDRQPIFIATLRAARLLAGCFVAHRSKTTAGILPLNASPARTFAHPAKIRSSATTPVTDLVHYNEYNGVIPEERNENQKNRRRWAAKILVRH